MGARHLVRKAIRSIKTEFTSDGIPRTRAFASRMQERIEANPAPAMKRRSTFTPARVPVRKFR